MENTTATTAVETSYSVTLYSRDTDSTWQSVQWFDTEVEAKDYAEDAELKGNEVKIKVHTCKT